jgi:transcriptional regulator of acetoin/glycerol metabolism
MHWSMDRIRCRNCELVQKPADVCRRCQRSLSEIAQTQVVTVTVEKVVERAVPLADSNLSMREIERIVVQARVKQCNGSVDAAAKSLGLSRNTVYSKLSRDRRRCSGNPKN